MSLRSLALALLSVALVAGGLSATAGPAEATSYSLCKGYSGCSIRGYGNAGYDTARTNMYWRMYSGHNCTNYVAYRLVHGGLPNVRPWTGSGNATNWGVAMSSITDQTPTVGAVAWWKAYVPPAGSVGHVAYVEQVISKDEIVVSQDSWGGDFSWARITRVGGKWPSGFVHFRDTTISSTAAPVISGTAKVGAPLQASAGTWSPLVVTLGYQWFADGVAVPGATKASFTPANAQLGKAISVRVTAGKAGYQSRSVVTPATAAVLPAAVTSTAPPVLTGTPQVSAALTATPGTWSPAPDTVSYQWIADGAAIAKATTSRLPLSAALVGKRVSVKVTARRSGYPAVTATTAAPTPVAPGTFDVTTAPTISGTARWGQTLRAVSLGTYTGSPATSLRWTRDGVPIPGATGTTYRPHAADIGHVLASQVTLTRAGYTTIAVASAPTVPVAAETFRVTRSPAVSGTPTYGQTLRLSDPGAYTGAPATAVQWLRDGIPVGGATGTTYKLGVDDIGHAVAAQVTLSRAGYATLAVPSAATGKVAALRYGIDKRPTVTGTPAYGRTLTMTDLGSYTGGPTRTIQWLVDGVPVPGANARTYRLSTRDLGHQVNARVVLTGVGHRQAIAPAPRTPVITTTSRLSVHAVNAGAGRLTTTVRVVAPGLFPVEGVVRVRDGAGRLLGQVSLVNGTGTTTLKLPRGTQTLRSRFMGSAAATPAILLSRVVVR